MIQGILEIGERKISCSLPETARDWQLTDYVDFVICVKQILNSEGNTFELMAKAIQVVTNVNIHDILSADMGEDYEPSAGEITGVNQMFGYLKETALKYTGKQRNKKDFRVRFAGKTYYMPLPNVLALVLNKQPTDVTVYQAAECLEIIRLSTEMMKKKSEDHVAIGNLWFSQYIKMIALLLQDESQDYRSLTLDLRERVFKQKTLLFSGNKKEGKPSIDLETALDIDFFLQIILLELKKTHAIAGSLSLHLFGLAGVTQRLKLKATKPEKEKVRKRLSA